MRALSVRMEHITLRDASDTPVFIDTVDITNPGARPSETFIGVNPLYPRRSIMGMTSTLCVRCSGSSPEATTLYDDTR